MKKLLNMPINKNIIKAIFQCTILILCIIVFTNVIVLQQTKNNPIYTSVGDLPTSTLPALIFGGGMLDDGSMTNGQTDRVIQGIAAYEARKVGKIIMTGDDGANRFNEVDAMHDFAVQRGVDDEFVDIDPHGYNTYASCKRAKEVYGLDEVVAISQSFHLPRIGYYCNQAGVSTTLLAADLQQYGWTSRIWGMGLREVLARVKAVGVVQVQ